MESLVYVPTYEVFLVLDSLRACFGDLVDELFGIAGQIGADLLGVDAYYRTDTDLALLALRFDERELTARMLEALQHVAAGAGFALLDPAHLDEADRRAFYRGYLARYDVRVEDRRTLDDALISLAGTLNLPVPSARPDIQEIDDSGPTEVGGPTLIEAPRLPGPAAARGKPEPRQRTSTAPAWPHGSPPARLPTLPLPDDTPTPSLPPGRGARAPRPPSAPRIDPGPPPLPLPPPPAAPTVHDLRPDPAGRTRPRTGGRRLGSDPPLRAPTQPPSLPLRTGPAGEPPPPPPIVVRFRRGDQWTLGRLRALSLNGASVATGAPPRLHDDVHVALSLGQHGAVVLGTVVHAVGVGAGSAGEVSAAGFNVAFSQVGGPARQQLADLLQTARSLGVVLEPPPPRRDVRYPVRWPVHLVTPAQQVQVLSATDVSRRGMFIATLEQFPEGAMPFEFYLPLEDGGMPIHGRARIARRVPWKLAHERGLISGFGAEITLLSGIADQQRYGGFVERVKRRVGRRLVVGAGAARADDLVAGLTAAGYTVSGTSDPSVLLQAAECDARAPDAALIDTSLRLDGPTAQRLQEVLAHREVPWVTISGDGADRVRAVVDGLLAVT